jgi:hypothetical protein
MRESADLDRMNKIDRINRLLRVKDRWKTEDRSRSDDGRTKPEVGGRKSETGENRRKTDDPGGIWERIPLDKSSLLTIVTLRVTNHS